MRVKHAYVACGEAQIELDRWAQRDSSLRCQRASTHVAFELGDVDAVFGDRQRTVAVLKSNRQVGRGECGVDHVDGSCDVRTVSCAVRVDVELELTGGSQVGIEKLGKVQIDGAEQEKRHRRVAGGWNRPLELQIGVGTVDRRALHAVAHRRILQDDFKVTPKLTLNLGIRYEYDQPWYEQNDKTAHVLPGGIVEYAGHVPTGAVPGSIVCPTKACYNGNYKQIMPRLGFAWNLKPNTVVRGGYGATSFFEGYSFNQRLTSSPPFSLAINTNAPGPTTTSGGTPFTVEQGFGGQQYGINPNYNLYSQWPQNVQPAYIHQYNFTVEQALSNSLSLSVGYHGQNGFHLADYRDGNQLTIAQAPGVAAILNSPGGSCSSAFPASLRPPYYSLLGECSPLLTAQSEARMNYNAAQVTLRQRSHYGLEYSLNYTWQKSLNRLLWQLFGGQH